MIGNISKGRGFRGTLNYLLEKEKGELIGGNMLGQTARELAAEFKLSRQLNPTIKQPVYHVSLSLPLSERLDSERWNAIASDYLQEMGFTDNQYVVVRHSDRSHDHIHIVAARGRLDGKCVNDWQDYYRSQNVIRNLEISYHLEVVAPSWEVERRGITKGQFEQIRREEATGQYPTPSVKQQIQGIADRVIQECATPEQFVEKMKDAGVDVQLRTRRDGSISGISYQYELDGITVATPGTKLGTDYTWNGIHRRIQELSHPTVQSHDSELVSAQHEREYAPVQVPDGSKEKDSFGATNNSRSINPQQLTLEQFTDSELLEAPIAVADYFAAEPPQPPSLDEQQAVQYEINRLVYQINSLWKKQSEQVKLAESMQKNPFHAWSNKYDAIVKQVETTMSALSQSYAQKDQKESQQKEWNKQSRTYQEWDTSPQTQAMRQLAAFLDLSQVQSRLEALKQIQFEGRATAQAVQDLFKLTGTERQPDGELIFDGNNWRLKQLGNTVSVTVKADDREILRVEGGKVVVFEPTPEERETMQHFREQVQSERQNEQQRQLEAERKQSQELSL